MPKRNAKIRQKIPWPTKDVMQQIYEQNLWGSHNTKFYSGEGSHKPEIVTPYLEKVKAFLSSFTTPISILDLGCGDFNIGKQLVEFSKSYIAIDIVPSLIKYNQQKFVADNLTFLCKDIVTEPLPDSDCIILRQVLQHLSNAEVHQILKKLAQFKYIILTEHLPNENFEPNKDIISGQGIRLKKKSGINILAPPFNFKVKEYKELQHTKLLNGKGCIVTYLYRVF